MKNQFAKIVAVLMVLAMAVSVFGLCVSAEEAETTLILGDVNLSGEVTIKDATLLQKDLAKIATLDEIQKSVADATEDGKLNIKDASAIQKWLAKFEDANQNIGQPMDVATGDEPVVDPATKDEATKDEATKDEATKDEATNDEPVVDPSTKDEETPVDPSTKDEETPVDPATKDEATVDEEATEDEPVMTYYLVGWINSADVFDTSYAFVDGVITVTLADESYVAVQDAEGTIFWTDGWLGKEVNSAVLGTEYAKNDKLFVPAGTATFTWDAATSTLSYVVA